VSEQRDFLLRSLDDLEAEYAAGDLDDGDYRALKADYTRRAAAAIRAGEQAETPRREAASPSARMAAWAIGVVILAVIAGLLLGRFSGSRDIGGTVSGDIRETVREQLFDAQQAFGSGDLEGAIEIYDEILEEQPSNAEALAYRGWFTNLGGDAVAGRALVEDAIAFEPEYPDARVFGASLALEVGDADAAAAHLAVLDTLDVPPFVDQLLTQFQLRERVAAALDPDGPPARRAAALARVAPILLVDAPPPFSETDLGVDDVILAGEALAAQGDALEALQLFDHVLEERADDVDLIAARGWLMARLPSDELRAIGEQSLDEALGIDPDHPAALVYRSAVRVQLGDLEGAAADLAGFDALASPPPELVTLVEQLGLRAAIDAGG
jgi:tetratricopeptide (TPR) repeat protein